MRRTRQNFCKENTWHPEAFAYPKSLEELLSAIAKARAANLPIRIAGSLHSFNSLAATPGMQIHMDHLDKVLVIDPEKQTVKVEGGIKVEKLLYILAKDGLTLSNQGYYSGQTIAGAIATATHGSGKTGTFCSFVTQLDLVDAEGNIHTLNPKINRHLFSAAVMSLGCLGVVYSLTLQCISLHKLKLRKVKTTAANISDRFLTFLYDYDYFQAAIDPYSKEAIAWCYQKTETGFYNGWKYLAHRMLIKMLALLTFNLFNIPSWMVPKLLKIYLFLSPFKSCVDYSYRLLSPSDEGRYVEEEIAVPLECFAEALKVTQEIIDRYSEDNIRAVVIILVRFTESDLYAYLSPSQGRKTAYISLVSLVKEGYQQIFNDVEEALYKFEGKPHWGKVNHLTSQKVFSLYGERATCFREAMFELDPQGVFSNEEIKRLFF